MHSYKHGPFSLMRPWKGDKVTAHYCADRLFRPIRLLLNESNRKNKSLAAILCLFLLNLVSPKIPELKCHGNSTRDPEISHAYTGETITTSMVLSVIIFLPLFEFLIAEWIINKKPQNPYGFHPAEGTRWKRTLFYASRWYRDYFFGIAFMILINDIAKTTVGAPRPHWIDSCQPQFPADNCYLGWVKNYTCTNEKFSRWKLADARKSFPSGHAALSFYSGFFMILYQMYRLNTKKLGSVAILWLHAIWGLWAVYCSLSRISDRRHHPIDVTCGAILGATFACLTAIVMCRKFRKELNLEPYQNKIVSGLNGNATILEGYSSSPCPSHLVGMGNYNGGGGGGPGGTPNGGVPRATDMKRPSLRRLLSTQSNVTTMSDIAEDRELDNL